MGRSALSSLFLQKIIWALLVLLCYSCLMAMADDDCEDDIGDSCDDEPCCPGLQCIFGKCMPRFCVLPFKRCNPFAPKGFPGCCCPGFACSGMMCLPD